MRLPWRISSRSRLWARDGAWESCVRYNHHNFHLSISLMYGSQFLSWCWLCCSTCIGLVGVRRDSLGRCGRQRAYQREVSSDRLERWNYTFGHKVESCITVSCFHLQIFVFFECIDVYVITKKFKHKQMAGNI